MNNLLLLTTNCPDDYRVLKVLSFIMTIIKIVCIVLPIILIIMIILDVAKAVVSNDESAIKKALSSAVKRLISCICVFFVPTIVSLVFNLLGDLGVDYAMYINCANLEDIERVVEEQASELIKVAASTYNYSDYEEAKDAVEEIKNESIKRQYENELASILAVIDGNMPSLDGINGNIDIGHGGSKVTPGTDTSGKYLYTLKNADSEYSGHTVELTDTQYLYICRALLGEREAASYEIYVALAQYIRDHVDAYKLAGTNVKNYDNIGTRWLISAGGNRAGSKTVDWIQENRPEIIQAVDYVFKEGGSFAQGFMEFYVDKYDGSTPEIASNNLITVASQHCQPYGGNYSNHENFTLYPEWGDTNHWFSCSICPWYSGVKAVTTKRTN